MYAKHICELLLDHASVGMGLYDTEGNILFYNAIASRYIGKDNHALAGKNVQEIFPGKQGEIFMSRIRKALCSKRILEYEDQIRLARKKRWFLTTYQAIRDDSGNMIGVLLISDEITKVKAIQEQLDQAKDFYENVLETVKDGIWVADRKDRIIFANQAMCQIAGVEKDQLVGMRVPDFPEEVIKEFYTFYHEARQSLQAHSYDAKVITPGGRLSYQRGWLIPRVIQEEYAGMICTIQDVTEERIINRKLTETRDRAQLYLDLVGSIILGLDTNGFITMINKTGCKILGAQEKDILNKNWFDEFLPPDLVKEVKGVFEKIVTGIYPGLDYYVNDVIDRSGIRRKIAWHNTILRDADDKIVGVLSSGNDVTDQMNNLDELNNKIEELEMFNQLMVGRENKMISLKEEINELCSRLNEPPRYRISDD